MYLECKSVANSASQSDAYLRCSGIPVLRMEHRGGERGGPTLFDGPYLVAS